MGFDSARGTDKPRSTIRHLEEEIARLEIELSRAKEQNQDVAGVAYAEVEKLAAGLVTAIVDPPECSSRMYEDLLPLTSPFFLSGSPVPHLNSLAWGCGTEDAPSLEGLPPPISVSSIPRAVVDTMMKHYCDIYRPMYPAIEESDLLSACERVYNNAEPSSYDIFCVHITLAISVWAYSPA